MVKRENNGRPYVEFDDSIEIGKLNFATPVVCLFSDSEDEPVEGIAYGKEIICLDCGGIIPLDECFYLSYYYDDVWPTIEVFG